MKLALIGTTEPVLASKKSDVWYLTDNQRDTFAKKGEVSFIRGGVKRTLKRKVNKRVVYLESKVDYYKALLAEAKK